MRNLLMALLALASLVMVTPSADAQRAPKPLKAGMISAEEAHARAAKGELVLLDIRTPEEWKETGVGAGAHALTMHQRAQAFIAALDKITGGDKTKPIALICATGGRSADLKPALSRLGYSNIVDVGEGMEGSEYGPGWKKRGLPTVPPPAVQKK